MKKISDIYSIIKECRERIIKTMQERGITEMWTYMSPEEWAKANGRSIEDVTEDDSEYEEYKWETTPYVVHFDKHGFGTEYRVEKVTLKKEPYGDSEYTFKFDCVGSEDSDWFWEEDIYFDTRINVWDALEERLGIEDEPEKVYVFTAEQAWDGEVADIIVKTFRTREAAREFMHEFIHEDGDESIEDYVKRKGWEVEMDEPNLYRACEDGRYSTDHIEITITECNIE